MASLLSLKRRIQAAQNVSKTTRALQMIAASKMKRAQEAALNARPYVTKLTEITVSAISKAGENFSHPYITENKDTEKTLVIVLSPDKGLCGGLITNLQKEFYSYQKEHKNDDYVILGRKLESFGARSGENVIANFLFGTSTPTFDMVYPIARIIDDNFVSGKVSSVKVIYTHFDSIFSQKPRVETLLPFSKEMAKSEEQNTKGKTDVSLRANNESAAISSSDLEYVYEPTVTELLPSLLKHTVEMRLFQFLLESFVSEQGARMIAMQNATDNANDIIAAYRLEYNKTRQAKITSEILDIGSGAAMVNN